MSGQGQSYERSPRWTAVDTYTFTHLHSPSSPHSSPAPGTLTHVLQNSSSKGLPDIAVSPSQGKFLKLQAQIARGWNSWGTGHYFSPAHQRNQSESILCALSPPTRIISQSEKRPRELRQMCYILYTLHVCGHWVPQPTPGKAGNGAVLRICESSEINRLGRPCPETEHKVANRSQGMCDGCLWERVKQ